MNDNLNLWNSVSRTDPQYTKSAKKGMFQFTAIAPIYQFKMATEQFGVQGIGWGVDPSSEKFTEQEYGSTILLAYDAVLFFKIDGERGEIPIHATEKIMYQTQGSNGYLKIDDEARKKVVTNAKTKGLSELGFNADVFLGEFDDHQYVDNARREFDLENAENKIEEAAKQEAEHLAWIDKSIQIIEDAVSLDALKTIYTSLVRKANLRGDKSVLIRFEKAKNTAKTRLES